MMGRGKNMMYLIKALHVASKDVRLYFFKWPNITFGLFFPVIMYVSFAIGKTSEFSFTIPGLVAMAILFGAGAIQSVALPLERSTGTFNRLLSAPIPMAMVVTGKAVAGFVFGLVIAGVYSLAILFLTGISPVYPVIFTIGIVLSSFTFSAFGLAIAAPFRDIPQAMPPATLLRVMLVFLSGVFIPIEEIPAVLQFIACLSPLTPAVNMLGQAMTIGISIPIVLVDMAILIVYAIVFILTTIVILNKTNN